MNKEKLLSTITPYRYQFTAIILIILLYIWLDPIITLKYIQALRWPILILILVVLFKKEISKLVWKSFNIKGFGLELEAKLANQLQNPLESNENNSSYSLQIQQLTESHKIITGTNEELQKKLAIQELQLDFERIYNLIFGSQFTILENLSSTSHTQSYESIMAKYTTLFFNTPAAKVDFFAKYFDFLLKNNLIEEVDNTNIKITDKGKAFVYYIRNVRHYLGNKPF